LSSAQRRAAKGRSEPRECSGITGFSLSARERADLRAFFDSLTDEPLLADERFANPWSAAELANATANPRAAGP
jgi:hypothetical protein